MDSSPPVGRPLGRYVLHDEIASGGMASVHFGRMVGPGHGRTVAVKKLHPHLSSDPRFVSMFLDEARLASHVQHPNVVATLDAVMLETELFLVMEYVSGEALSVLLRSARKAGAPVPPAVASSIVCGVLRGLHAAHEARDERGDGLGIVHRDVSPQNVIVGTDGIARVTDFGIAQATSRVSPAATEDEELKGKLAYMSPEQLERRPVDRRTDVYAAAVVLWEALAGRRLFRGTPEAIAAAVKASEIPPLPSVVPEAARVVTMRGLARHLAFRFATAREMALALEAAVPPAMPRVVGAWVEERAAESLERQSAKLKAMVPIAPPAA